MNKKWCPYTGKKWLEKELNEDHIIPISIGGHDQFTVMVNQKEHSKLNKELDEKIKDMPIISSFRQKNQLSRRKKTVKAKWDVEKDGVNGKIDFSNDDVSFQTFRSLNDDGINLKSSAGGETFSTKFTLDSNLLLRFSCKLALGAGYFLFKDAFIDYGHHDSIREIMNTEKAVDALIFIITNKEKDSNFWIIPWPQSVNPKLPAELRAICYESTGHLIFTYHMSSEIILGISLFSNLFKFYFSIAKTTDSFPNSSDFELGRILVFDIIDKKMRASSLKQHMIDLKNSLLPITT